ncbi:phosphoribosylanthranilate isomerase [Tautonia plasticadhaerens]|uniref:N-(5'-phosphoribosyl)anthranilate isomerase n=1 Tax=Tautonia plasticadhaerens TaxID=2527974 RepID=A0A518GWA6_9BACT|nr:phosphoribosylanthranilate isomerase [Tautonia plasticadhaerens]QDV32875.1 N-(5'-phosphoribosyl)anthranilate isomerase [Tautonia plasticadhaerens]
MIADGRCPTPGLGHRRFSDRGLTISLFIQSPLLVKICGVTTTDDARMVAEAGADWIGVNFHPASKRFVPPELAPELVAAIAGLAEPVGLFVDRPVAEVAETLDRAGIRIAQLHGDEPAEDVRDLRLLGYRVVRAFRLGGRDAVDRMAAWLRHASRIGGEPEAVLVDAFVPGQAGGTGHAIAGEVLDALADRPRPAPARSGHPPADPAPKLILAGGLTPANVADLAARIGPWMVDVASGVESSPGLKDPAKVAAFVRAARSP